MLAPVNQTAVTSTLYSGEAYLDSILSNENTVSVQEENRID